MAGKHGAGRGGWWKRRRRWLRKALARRGLGGYGLPALGTAAVVLAALVGARIGANASGDYTGGTQGYDISWPQCGAAYPAQPFDFGIVGVNDGRPFGHNPCLASQWAWANGAAGRPSVYINLMAPIGGLGAAYAGSGPAGTCSRPLSSCGAYNFGANAAADAVAYATSQGIASGTWWLDVETVNSWLDDRRLNAEVIRGAAEYLESNDLEVGVYSTAYQWAAIAGAYAPRLPIWVAGASDEPSALEYCSPTHTFGGGSVVLVQYPRDGFDGLHACDASR